MSTLSVTASVLGLAAAAALALCERRRRARALRVARALHELRRPLQMLQLSRDEPEAGPTGVDAVALAGAALTELERELAGRRPAAGAAQLVDPQRLLELALVRWGGPVRPVTGSPERLSAAIDNLVANACEHGSGPVTLGVRPGRGTTRIEVRSGAGPPPLARQPRGRGHGLELVNRIAADHGGRFDLDIGPDETVAALELPTTGR